MKITLKNLGIIKRAEFELGDLTIICGTNNTGKTYTTYALFGFLETIRETLNIEVSENTIEILLRDGTTDIDLERYLDQVDDILKVACQTYTQQLSEVFAAKENLFQHTEFSVKLANKPLLNKPFKQKISTDKSDIFSLIKEENNQKLSVSLLAKRGEIIFPPQFIKEIIADVISDILFNDLLPNVFIASAERTGAAIFQKELDFARSRLLKAMHKDIDMDPRQLLTKNYHDYALPVEKNVEFIRTLQKIVKKDSFITKKHPDILEKIGDIIGGTYIIDKNIGLYFQPENSNIKLTMSESSSAVRSLLDISFYIRHIAKPGDLFIIDEPELNLHPQNQRYVARLLASLINVGIKVCITTHSDYIVKEFSTLIMLKSNDRHLQKIAKDENYDEQILLSADQVKTYIAKEALIKLDDNRKRRSRNNTLVAVDINDEFGIQTDNFDETINKMNQIQEAIIWR